MDDIEDIIRNNSINNFTKSLANGTYSTEKDYIELYNNLRKIYKLSPSKPLIRHTYYQLLNKKIISENKLFEDFSIKKKGKSSSGVSVITILTSPTPEYTNLNGEKVKQSFSCGHNCSYCPNEPELRINLKIIYINEEENIIKVTTKEDLKLIRILSYIIHNGINHKVFSCKDFTENTFIIEFSKIDPGTFIIDDIIIGVKSEQPRSYLSTEPAVIRANRNDFDPILQIYDRADALSNCGHEVDKIEILVLGGTWDNYPIDYQIGFIRDIYYSINSLNNRNISKLSLDEEIKRAQYSEKRIIGLTLETRPDYITIKQIRKIREFNVTRLQIGVQHIDNDILQFIERGCVTKDIEKANYLWKHNGGKVDWHLMPDLPGSSVQKDINMFQKIFGVEEIINCSKNHFRYKLKYPELQADQLKIYPCSVVNWTQIKKWYEEGTYIPYSEKEEDLIEVIAFIKNNVFPWIRLNRIIRDIPNISILGGNKNVNLRQTLLNKKEIHCKCIRCREIKGKSNSIDEAVLFIREYNAINATEYFISFESKDQKILYGFLRLRINTNNEGLIYKGLNDCSFIRELHIYGKIVKHTHKNSNKVQHQGLGKKLIQKAEEISTQHNIHKIAIISGVGVREYYHKLGYKLIHNYMIKELNNNSYQKYKYVEYSIIFLIIAIIISILYDIYTFYKFETYI